MQRSSQIFYSECAGIHSALSEKKAQGNLLYYIFNFTGTYFRKSRIIHHPQKMRNLYGKS